MRDLGGSEIDFEDEAVQRDQDLPVKIIEKSKRQRGDQQQQTVEPQKETKEEDPPENEKLDFDEPSDYEDDGIGDELFIDDDNTLSYNKLMKFIAKNHPVDDSNPKDIKMFSILERITVKDYYFRLMSMCGCYRAYRKAKRKQKEFHDHERGKQKKRFSLAIRPEESVEQPIQKRDDAYDSEISNDEGHEETQINGITEASLKLGAGPVLYLQILKTLSILFFILVTINMPIYLLYAKSTANNAYTDTEEGLRFFTIGNLGQSNPGCGHSAFDFSGSQLQVRCPVAGQYMTSIETYGFMQYSDPKTLTASSGEKQCAKIENDRWEKRDRRLQDKNVEENRLNNTKYNLDNNCYLENSMFFKDSQSQEKIQSLFEKNCYEKTECELTGLQDYFSKTCEDRTVKDKSGLSQMSDQFIFVV